MLSNQTIWNIIKISTIIGIIVGTVMGGITFAGLEVAKDQLTKREVKNNG